MLTAQQWAVGSALSTVPQAIITALAENEFHAFPDTMARQVGGVYRDFASNIVEANLMEG